MQKEKIIQELEELKNDNRFRVIKTNDKSLYNFSSNDYLGLAHDKDLLQKFYQNYSFDNYKLSSSSSRLIAGS